MSGKHPLGKTEQGFHSFATTARQLARIQQVLDMGLFPSRSELIRTALMFFQTEDLAFDEDTTEGIVRKSITYTLTPFWGKQMKASSDKSLIIRRAVNKLLVWCAPLISVPVPEVAAPRYERCCWE
jgi:Arc/MetJ-type ribon-helix-helix transcriptional regulator